MDVVRHRIERDSSALHRVLADAHLRARLVREDTDVLRRVAEPAEGNQVQQVLLHLPVDVDVVLNDAKQGSAALCPDIAADGRAYAVRYGVDVGLPQALLCLVGHGRDVLTNPHTPRQTWIEMCTNGFLYP